MARPSASRRGDSGVPLDRDDIASHLEATLIAAGGHSGDGVSGPEARLSLLSEPEALAVAELFEELQGVYRDEPLGWLARSLAHRIHERLGR